ncbi:hypothetical protein [Halorhodospira neutriphila]|uniref:Uncharacterized protein n=1 Tax=Halorhodospira neutriphila TaxID=168379 RepID=A0ABS1E3S3_9GAMM|nr:hypothetical protein [Halorhodospira neutriphila]MBK1725623.1 hypothetical protein [Halorhodospira neutriphila]
MERLLLSLDPTAISATLLVRTPGERLRLNLGGALLPGPVRRGRWDRRTLPVEAHPVYRLMYRLDACGYEPEAGVVAFEAYFRERGLSLAAAREKARRKGAALVRRYAGLVQGMAAEGYRPGRAPDEIGVAIARDGTLLKAPGGQHRFAAARLLGLDRVTAEVRYIHRDWQRGCSGLDPVSLCACIGERLGPACSLEGPVAAA